MQVAVPLGNALKAFFCFCCIIEQTVHVVIGIDRVPVFAPFSQGMDTIVTWLGMKHRITHLHEFELEVAVASVVMWTFRYPYTSAMVYII